MGAEGGVALAETVVKTIAELLQTILVYMTMNSLFKKRLKRLLLKSTVVAK